MTSALATSTGHRILTPAQAIGTDSAVLRTEPMDLPQDSWTCPATGLVVPKRLKQNLQWRMELRRLAEKDAGFRSMLLTACKVSPTFWINAFVWTYRQKEVGPSGLEVPIMGNRAHVPFITWPVQDEAIELVYESIAKGEDVNFEKSRDMGATWLLLTIADQFFLFQNEVNIGAVSRKEELVDKGGDMDTLFEKIRYIHRLLPVWMRPRIRDRFMFLHNEDLNSTIAGESTNTEVGRGGRKTFYFVDEAAAITHAESVEASLSQNTPCQIWASTPHGPNTQFHQRIKQKKGKLIQLPWWRHPEKAAGAHQVRDPLGKIHWTSPWYERLPDKFSNKTIAQEVDMDHGQSGDMFFDYTELMRHRQDHVREPDSVGNIVWIEDMTETKRLEQLQSMDPSKMMFSTGARKTPWRLWCALIDGRPPQQWSYVAGIDISNGAGASNSVISILARETGQIVAKFWDAYTSPEELAMIAASAGVWFGGRTPPVFMCWENNGPGGIFGRKLVQGSAINYPSFYRQRADNSTRNKKTPRWGWHSNQERKEVLLGMYRDAIGRDDIVVPCAESLDEAADYIYDGTGAVIPATIKEEPSGGRMLHGDHVIADALCWLAKQEFGRQEATPAAIPHGSYAWRRQHRKAKDRRKDPWSE